MMSVIWSVGIGLLFELSCSPEHAPFNQPFVINEIKSMGNDSIELFNRTYLNALVSVSVQKVGPFQIPSGGPPSWGRAKVDPR